MHFSLEVSFNKANGWMPNGWSCVCCFSDIFMCNMEKDVLVPAKPIFYKRHVDETYIHRSKNVNHDLFQNLNSYHTNIKLNLGENPRKFLGTEIIRKNSTISTQVFTKLTKFPVHWGSKIPTNYKRNAINSELHRAKQISQRNFYPKEDKNKIFTCWLSC